jgi:hypothetical protein
MQESGIKSGNCSEIGVSKGFQEKNFMKFWTEKAEKSSKNQPFSISIQTFRIV